MFTATLLSTVEAPMEGEKCFISFASYQKKILKPFRIPRDPMKIDFYWHFSFLSENRLPKVVKSVSKLG
jgi:hypothetical protein